MKKNKSRNWFTALVAASFVSLCAAAADSGNTPAAGTPGKPVLGTSSLIISGPVSVPATPKKDNGKSDGRKDKSKTPPSITTDTTTIGT